jgi:hypothetical protein
MSVFRRRTPWSVRIGTRRNGKYDSTLLFSPSWYVCSRVRLEQETCDSMIIRIALIRVSAECRTSAVCQTTVSWPKSQWWMVSMLGPGWVCIIKTLYRLCTYCSHRLCNGLVVVCFGYGCTRVVRPSRCLDDVLNGREDGVASVPGLRACMRITLSSTWPYPRLSGVLLANRRELSKKKKNHLAIIITTDIYLQSFYFSSEATLSTHWFQRSFFQFRYFKILIFLYRF